MAEAVRPKPLKATPKIRKVTVKMPTQHKDRLPTQILADGYNMRQKSQWVREAVESLLANPHWEGALVSERLVKVDAVDVFTMPTELMVKVKREARRVNALNPSLNANQSTIIRAAIARRMLGIYTRPTS
jgi:Arc/MetJ-type ribon-helix-helix transcriptional regulator